MKHGKAIGNVRIVFVGHSAGGSAIMAAAKEGGLCRVAPEAIIGDKDAKDSDDNPIYQQIDHSKLVPLLVKTIQELEARITTLEG